MKKYEFSYTSDSIAEELNLPFLPRKGRAVSKNDLKLKQLTSNSELKFVKTNANNLYTSRKKN